MKVVIASGIYPPEPGGPAIHAQKFAQFLRERGHGVEVIAYGDAPNQEATIILRRAPKGIRHLLYGLRLWRLAKKADTIFALDAWSAGFPAAVVAVLRSMPLVIRLGGDFLWEQAVNERRLEVTRVVFYEENLLTSLERVKKFFISRVLDEAEFVIAPSENLCGLYRRFYDVEEEKFRVIDNPCSAEGANIVAPPRTDRRVFLFAGRLIRLKNLSRVFAAAKMLREQGIGNFMIKIIGSGPEEVELKEAVARLGLADKVTFLGVRSPQDVGSEVAKSNVCIAVALTEESPNFVLQSLAYGRPCIVSAECAIKDTIAPFVIFADPLSVAQIADAMRALITDDGYEVARQRLAAVHFPVVNFNDTYTKFFSTLEEAVQQV